MIYKTTVNLPEDALEAIQKIAVARKISMADVIRSAIATELHLFDATQTGGVVFIEDAKGKQWELLF